MSDRPTAVAMSGGVDSSVAACLLAREGRRVVGFSMQLVDRLAGEENRYGRCCSPDDFRDARRVADHFGFPHYVVDLEEDFRRLVIQPFADDYAAGRTPSPCVRCNTYLKFGVLMGRARAADVYNLASDPMESSPFHSIPVRQEYWHESSKEGVPPQLLDFKPRNRTGLPDSNI